MLRLMMMVLIIDAAFRLAIIFAATPIWIFHAFDAAAAFMLMMPYMLPADVEDSSRRCCLAALITVFTMLEPCHMPLAY